MGLREGRSQPSVDSPVSVRETLVLCLMAWVCGYSLPTATDQLLASDKSDRDKA